MTIENLENELNAIKSIITVLEPLDYETKKFVLETVFRKLNISDYNISKPSNVQPHYVEQVSKDVKIEKNIHIRDLKNEKKPTSANEMAAIVAYYLGNCVPESEKKEFITTKDLETYFKIAEYKLPSQIRFTLNNAKKSGYFDITKEGEYKLNAIGYNLVVHSLPKENK